MAIPLKERYTISKERNMPILYMLMLEHLYYEQLFKQFDTKLETLSQQRQDICIQADNLSKKLQQFLKAHESAAQSAADNTPRR
jgi:hypothetical protein